MVAAKGKGGKANVIVYSTPSCPYCVMAKEFLGQHGIKYKDVDVAADEQAAQEMIAKSDQMGVPVIDINGSIVVGFDREKLKELLGIK